MNVEFTFGVANWGPWLYLTAYKFRWDTRRYRYLLWIGRLYIGVTV